LIRVSSYKQMNAACRLIHFSMMPTYPAELGLVALTEL